MSVVSFATQTITRRRAPLVEGGDAYGNDVLDWSAATDVDIDGVSVQPVEIDEINDGEARASVQRRWLVLADAGTDLVATDRVVFRGGVYEVAGAPAVYETSVLDHVELYLIDFRG